MLTFAADCETMPTRGAHNHILSAYSLRHNGIFLIRISRSKLTWILRLEVQYYCHIMPQFFHTEAAFMLRCLYYYLKLCTWDLNPHEFNYELIFIILVLLLVGNSCRSTNSHLVVYSQVKARMWRRKHGMGWARMSH